jgi:hypothetical protein
MMQGGYVSIAHDGTDADTVSAFRDSADKYLFTVNTLSPSISSYPIASDGSLTPLGSTPVSAATAPGDARLSPTAPPSGSSMQLPTRSAAPPSAAGAASNCRARPRPPWPASYPSASSSPSLERRTQCP